MTRNQASAKAAGSEVMCQSCGKTRTLKHPALAGKTCRACAAQKGSTAAAALKPEPIDRFAKFIALTDGGCWQWLGRLQPNGYSTFFEDGRAFRGHRWSYEQFIAPIPDELQIDHLCRNRACVNPEHLEPVTGKENLRRAMRTHCVNGHEFAEENTYVPADGKRYCRTCRRRRVREARARSAAA